jgi:CDGSH-type Zn-finger protein
MTGISTTITPKVNGPLRVEGPVRILNPDGTEIPIPPRKDGTPAQVVVLCRCGASATKPFCDGSHKRIGFDSSPRSSLPPAPRP